MTGPSTTHQVSLGDFLLTYTLTRKSVKRINLRICADGLVQISAPHRLPKECIDAFISEKSDAILRAIRRAELSAASTPAPLYLEEGAEVLHFGRPLMLHFKQGRSSFAMREDTLTLNLPNLDDASAIRRLFGQWQACELHRAVEPITERHFPAFVTFGKDSPTLRFRSMTSRWGSCRPSDGVITLNTCLAGAPLSCVEYVLIHELTHLHHPDHSPRFYAALSAYLPDWQARKAELDRLGRRLIPQKQEKTFQ